MRMSSCRKERRVGRSLMTKRPVNAGRFAVEKRVVALRHAATWLCGIEWYPLMRSGYRKPSGELYQ